MGNCSTTSASFPSETSNIVSRKPSDYDVLKQNWIEAINTGNISGCKFLHAEHASLINEVVDSVRQEKAIHVAARKKNIQALQYLLENQCEVDCRSANGNTPLLEAALNNDVESMKLLIKCGADVEIRNNSNQSFRDVCHASIKGYFTKAKIARMAKQGLPTEKNVDGQEILVYGVNVGEISQHELKQNDNNNNEKTMQQISKEGVCNNVKKNTKAADFGKKIECEVYEIAFYVEKIRNKGIIWDKLMQYQHIENITTHNQLCVLIKAVICMVLKNPRKQFDELDSQLIYELASKIEEKLLKSQNNSTFEFTKNYFVNKFHICLYEIHDEYAKITSSK